MLVTSGSQSCRSVVGSVASSQLSGEVNSSCGLCSFGKESAYALAPPGRNQTATGLGGPSRPSR